MEILMVSRGHILNILVIYVIPLLKMLIASVIYLIKVLIVSGAEKINPNKALLLHFLDHRSISPITH